jgi:branched-chain amino acid aminotransferase
MFLFFRASYSLTSRECQDYTLQKSKKSLKIMGGTEMESERWVFIKGEYKSKAEATVSVFDHGFLYGDGVFEGIRVYSGNVFRLHEHMVRLYESAKSILLDIPYTLEELEAHVVETVRKNQLLDAYIRLVVSRGEGPLGLDPAECNGSNVIIIVDKIRLYSQELYDRGLSVVTVPTRRNIPDALNPRVKSLNYLNNILAKTEAKQAGAAEAIILSSDGYVTEGSSDNIFMVKDNALYTPPCYLGALKGITRQAIMDIAAELGYQVTEAPFTRHDVFIADEVLLTGTGAEVISVVEVDGRPIGDGVPGPVFKDLITQFRKLVTYDGVSAFPSEVKL